MTASEKIREIIRASGPALLNIPEDKASEKSSAESWSKKEILGHLIDSASNNHQRFVRGAQNLAAGFPGYNQNSWVEIQAYNKASWSELVEFFSMYNLHLCRIIDLIPKEALDNPCCIGKESPVTLRFLIDDYLRHLVHHIKKILDE